MIELTEEYKVKVLSALADARERYDGSDSNFAKKYGINKSVYSGLKKGDIDRKISPGKWLELGRQLGVSLNERNWNMARTDVFNAGGVQQTALPQHRKSDRHRSSGNDLEPKVPDAWSHTI